MTSRVGQQLGSYLLVRYIKGGGFGEVYLGKHVHLGTEAAIKVLKVELASQQDVDDFRTEGQIIASLVHPHIIRVLDFALEGATPYLVMDYAPHGTLRERHPKGQPLPLATVLPYLRQVADALHYAHERDLIHRDIKPENMLLNARQEVLLSDFGIAIAAHSTHMQKTQGVAGTAAYMAPEQLRGHPRRASDQYALAVVLYEWLCGRCPFQGEPLAIATQHLFEPPPPLRNFVPTIPSAVEESILRALAKDPQQRYPTMSAFAAALEQAGKRTISAAPLSAAPPSAPLPTPPAASAAPPSAAPSSLKSLPVNVPLPPAAPPSVAPVPVSMPLSTTPTPASAPAAPSPPAMAPLLPRPLPAALLPKPLPAALPQRSSGPVTPAMPAQPQPRISRRRVLLGLAAGVLVVGGAAAYIIAQNAMQHSPSGTPTPAVTPTSTIIPGFVPYLDPALGVFLEYPQDWQQTSTQRDQETQYQGHRFSISSYAWLEVGSSPQYVGLTPDQINNATVRSLQTLPNAKTLDTSTPTPPTIHLDGQDWAVLDALLALNDGTVLQLTILAAVHQSRGYVIFYQSHQDEFMHFSTQYYEPMLLSFRFLSG